MIRVMTIANGKVGLAEWDDHTRALMTGLRKMQDLVGGYIAQVAMLFSKDGAIAVIANAHNDGEPTAVLLDSGWVVNGPVLIHGMDERGVLRSLTDADIAAIGTHAYHSELEPLNDELIVWGVHQHNAMEVTFSNN